jgi:hypothetical protein
MSLFVEVDSLEKNCKVIINLEHVVEIAPIAAGGCAIFFNDGASVGGVRTMKVKDSYPLFQQLVMTMITPEDISKKTKLLKEAVAKAGPKEEFVIPKL